MHRWTIVTLAALLAGPVAANERPAKAPAKERVICTYDTATGSHLRKKVCMTESERKARQLADQQRARELQNREFKTNIKD